MFVDDMNKVKKPLIDREKLGDNIFLSNLKIPVNKLVMAGQYRSDKDGDILPVEIELERDVSVRLYVDSDRRKQMIKLSARAKDLLMWLLYELDTGKDYIWINKDRYMKECGVKAYNTYKDAINELILGHFIQPTTVGRVYWINPHLFFNGSRLNAFPQNIVRK